MKKIILVLATAFISISYSFAQDIITKKNGDDVKSKIIEVTTNEVKYKMLENPDGPTFTILKSDILMIRYSNGAKDVFNELEKPNSSDGNIDLCDKGKADSRAFYRGQGSGSGWTVATTILFSPLIGLIPAAISSSSEPSMEDLNYPDNKLMKKSEYANCYIQQAHQKKKSKIWSSYGVSSAIWLGLMLLL